MCYFCQRNIKYIDFKETVLLSRFISQSGKIKPRKKTNLCAKHQRMVEKAIKIARRMALLPFVAD
ncbi:MAG: 30S ribosomal protein S18 [Candidatus Pacebacteria bacterium]|nr:30S ribosomal protein S18 [Candidatus Paceibacterota bacterium]